MLETRAPKKRVSMDELFGGLVESSGQLGGTTMLPVSQIEADPEQPRKTFTNETLRELADSLREQGMLQPVLVRPVGRDRYLLIAGERRWRAAQLAELVEIPVMVKDVDAPTTRVMSLVENLQREDLRDEEKAQALHELKRLRKTTWEEIARLVGLSEARVKALAMLNREPAEVQALMSSGITEKHLSLTRVLKDERRLSLLREVARRGLSTQQTREASDLLRADESLAVASALRHLLGGEASGNGRAKSDRVLSYVRYFERLSDSDLEDVNEDFLEALAALEKQVRTLRRRLNSRG
ncbi:MAG: ParB/RepB/Spo0J family partition protein [Armatimonadetes bacterium]|nr:ParB/RepB/Spo0J family partition protein [Armatimonadota bacterium]